MPRKPKGGKATEPDRHKNPVVSFRPDPALRDVLQQLAKRERRSVAQIVQIYLERGLQAAGILNPDP